MSIFDPRDVGELPPSLRRPAPEPERVWPCEHIRQDDKGRWKMEMPDLSFYIMEDNWDVCPRKGCHAPRPAEKPRTLELAKETTDEITHNMSFYYKITPLDRSAMDDCIKRALKKHAEWFREKVNSVNANCHGVQFRLALLRAIEEPND